MEDLISSSAVDTVIECCLRCLQQPICVSYNYGKKSNDLNANCQLGNKTRRQWSSKSGEWTFYQLLGDVSIYDET